ncbi:MAG: hypothetical protein JWM76_2481 [Pseudonocardiales bacterium]|nr:hypothetical protein [Pseudonocardiales bacterium]
MLPRLPERPPGLLEQKVADEYIVVEPVNQVAYALAGLPARVWEATEAGDHARWDQIASSNDIAEVVANLTHSGLFVTAVAAAGVSRRVALRTGGVVGLAGFVALALPVPADAASDSPAVLLTLLCGPNTVIGDSESEREIFFTIYGGGGSSGGWSDATAASDGGGGSGGYVTGSLIFPAGPETSFLVYPGCSDSAGAGSGYSRPGVGQSDVDGPSGQGGGGSGIEIGGFTLVVVGGGGGGGGSVALGSVPPAGGNGAGVGAGSRGTTSLAFVANAGGKGGTTTAGGAAGTPGSAVVAASAWVGPPALGGGSAGGGQGGQPSQVLLASPGGGGGGGYYGGGGGTGTNAGNSGGGGGGSGYIGGLTGNGSATIAGVTMVVTSTGVAPPGGPGAGAAAATLGSAPNFGTSGQAQLTTLGGFTLTNS